jgi:hypothetical protein
VPTTHTWNAQLVQDVMKIDATELRRDAVVVEAILQETSNECFPPVEVIHWLLEEMCARRLYIETIEAMEDPYAQVHLMHDIIRQCIPKKRFALNLDARKLIRYFFETIEQASRGFQANSPSKALKNGAVGEFEHSRQRIGVPPPRGSSFLARFQ